MLEFMLSENSPWPLDVVVGLIPEFLSERDPRRAAEQIDDRYAFGGGWRPIKGFKLDNATGAIRYPGDPAMLPLAFARLGEERIYVYESGFTMIQQPNGSFEVARLD